LKIGLAISEICAMMYLVNDTGFPSNIRNKKMAYTHYPLTIEKTIYSGYLNLKSRLHIKRFISKDSMHKFLNKQTDNKWQISKKNLKSGIYAFAGGEWHNVKSLDISTLAHI
jgi:hypothetical protein